MTTDTQSRKGSNTVAPSRGTTKDDPQTNMWGPGGGLKSWVGA